MVIVRAPIHNYRVGDTRSFICYLCLDANQLESLRLHFTSFARHTLYCSDVFPDNKIRTNLYIYSVTFVDAVIPVDDIVFRVTQAPNTISLEMAKLALLWQP